MHRWCKPIAHSVAPSTIKGASGPSSIYNEGEEDRHNMIHVLFLSVPLLTIVTVPFVVGVLAVDWVEGDHLDQQFEQQLHRNGIPTRGTVRRG